jgi:hypothetical protein
MNTPAPRFKPLTLEQRQEAIQRVKSAVIRLRKQQHDRITNTPISTQPNSTGSEKIT